MRAFILFFFLTGCAVKGEIGIGSTLKHNIGKEPTSYIGLKTACFGNFTCGWKHHSSIPNGPPFNDKEENVTDWFGIWKEFYFADLFE